MFLVTCSRVLVAQPTPSRMPLSLPRSTIANPPSAGTPTPLVMIQNRARVLGDRASANGTRYFSARDLDVAGKSSAEVLKRLSPPPVNSSDGIRKVEAVIELRHPLTVVSQSRDPILIGTTVVRGPVHSLEVITSIIKSEIKIIQK